MREVEAELGGEVGREAVEGGSRGRGRGSSDQDDVAGRRYGPKRGSSPACGSSRRCAEVDASGTWADGCARASEVAGKSTKRAWCTSWSYESNENWRKRVPPRLHTRVRPDQLSSSTRAAGDASLLLVLVLERSRGTTQVHGALLVWEGEVGPREAARRASWRREADEGRRDGGTRCGGAGGGLASGCAGHGRTGASCAMAGGVVERQPTTSQLARVDPLLASTEALCAPRSDLYDTLTSR